MVETLSDLLFQPCPDAVPQLFLALGENGILLILEPLDFRGFQRLYLDSISWAISSSSTRTRRCRR